jgi:hypothetical protein
MEGVKGRMEEVKREGKALRRRNCKERERRMGRRKGQRKEEWK